MPQKIETIDHACNVIRREFQAEFKDLTLFFIIHAPGERDKALINKRLELTEHPAGELTLPALRHVINEKTQRSKLVAIASSKEKSGIPLFKKNKTIAVFFINTADFRDPDETHQEIYHLTWHALSLLEYIKHGNKERYSENNNSFTPVHDEISIAREHMLADAFTAILLELSGQKNIIRILSKQRCLMSLQAIQGYKAEEYPFPVVAEAAKIVLKELSENNTKASNILHATNVTIEIGLTYDDTAIHQWSVFAKAAQEMAWMGFDKNKIMSTALYTSEDPYVRSTAYIVTEILNMEPAPITTSKDYNPFTEQEVNERLHKKSCEEFLKELLLKLSSTEDENYLKTMAQKQNAQLMDGFPIGWNAYAVMHAAEAFQVTGSNGRHINELVEEAFRHLHAQISWYDLIKFNRLVMEQRRNGQEITKRSILKLCTLNENYAPIAAAFEWAEPDSAEPPTLENKVGDEKVDKDDKETEDEQSENNNEDSNDDSDGDGNDNNDGENPAGSLEFA